MIPTSQHLGPILIVEDDPEDRMLAEDAINESQPTFPVRFLEDGEQLLAYLQHKGKYQEEDSNPPPGVIVMDLNMPRLDGREALAQIKAHPVFKSIPVIILTTSDNTQDIENCYSLGANSYITKPRNYRELVKIMEMIKNYWYNLNELPGKKA